VISGNSRFAGVFWRVEHFLTLICTFHCHNSRGTLRTFGISKAPLPTICRMDVIPMQGYSDGMPGVLPESVSRSSLCLIRHSLSWIGRVPGPGASGRPCMFDHRTPFGVPNAFPLPMGGAPAALDTPANEGQDMLCPPISSRLGLHSCTTSLKPPSSGIPDPYRAQGLAARDALPARLVGPFPLIRIWEVRPYGDQLLPRGRGRSGRVPNATGLPLRVRLADLALHEAVPHRSCLV
jgi:hypothetical protein